MLRERLLSQIVESGTVEDENDVAIGVETGLESPMFAHCKRSLM